MIILDLSGIVIAGIMKYCFTNDTLEVDETLVRNTVLNSIRYINQDFRKDYGKLVIACDGKSYWRKDTFPYYKINRKKKRDESGMDWPTIQSYLSKIKTEIKENFQYLVIEVDKAEADDIIGTVTRSFWRDENILIVSRDHDFIQLQKYKDVKQYSTVDRKFIENGDPNKHLFEKIIKGDSGDSIPNIFSPVNAIAMSIRQKPAYQKKIDSWWEEKNIPEEFKERFELNRKLIDLTLTPKQIQDKILSEFNNQLNKVKKSPISYFTEHGLMEFMSEMRHF